MELLNNISYVFYLHNKYIIFINIILVGMVVFFERKNPQSTLLWVLVLSLFPGIGFIFYILFGRNMQKNKKFQKKRKGDIIIEKVSNMQLEEVEKEVYRFKDINYFDYLNLIKLNLNSAKSVLTQDNAVEIFYEGKDKFNQLIEDIENAKKYILLEYYIFKSDKIGMKVIDALCKKAEEGLIVKVLYDGIGGREMSKEAIKKMEEAGIEIGVFFPPVFKTFSLRINHRNHRKLVVIDGEIGYIGGFNIGDEYVDDSDFGNWVDTHLRLMGSSVIFLQWRFITDWKIVGKEVDKSLYTSSGIDFTQKGTSGIQIVNSGPDTERPYIRDAFISMITNAKKNIFIQTPYFVPDEAVLEAIQVAIKSGVDVRVMIPLKKDHPFVHWANLNYIGEILKTGAKAYLLEDGFLHSKLIIVDDFVSTVGTTNMDIRSFYLNFEINAFIYDKEVNKSLREDFLLDISKSIEMTYEDYLKRPMTTRFKEGISRLLSPLL